MERRRIEAGIMGGILMSEDERYESKRRFQEDMKIFDEKTSNFLEYIFAEYGLT